MKVCFSGSTTPASTNMPSSTTLIGTPPTRRITGSLRLLCRLHGVSFDGGERADEQREPPGLVVIRRAAICTVRLFTAVRPKSSPSLIHCGEIDLNLSPDFVPMSRHAYERAEEIPPATYDRRGTAVHR